MAKYSEPFDNADYYNDDPVGFKEQPQKKKIPAIFVALLLLVGGSFFVQTTFAIPATVNLLSDVEFGQGITQTVACSGATDLTSTPNSTFTNASGAGAFYFSSVTVSNVPVGCYGKDFTIRAYGVSDSTPLALFNTTSTDAVVHNNDGSFEIGVGGGGATVSSGSGTFTVTFNSPVALASEVFKVTVESGAHTIFEYDTGDIGPGGGRIIYAAGGPYNLPPFNCGPDFSATGSPTGGQCRYLEAAPITGSNAWTDALYAWSPNTNSNTEIGLSAQGTATGSGYRNTMAMIFQSGGPSLAAFNARIYRGPSNLSDWYLPSSTEVFWMYMFQTSALGWKAYEGYWSSTEYAAGSARSYREGSEDRPPKSYEYYVRPIRAF